VPVIAAPIAPAAIPHSFIEGGDHKDFPSVSEFLKPSSDDAPV
jgi:hypothetical protein